MDRTTARVRRRRWATAVIGRRWRAAPEVRRRAKNVGLLPGPEVLIRDRTASRLTTTRRPDSGSAEIVLIGGRWIHVAAGALSRARILTAGFGARTRGSTGRRRPVVALHAEHAAGAGIGIEHEHPPIGREPFQAIMRFTVGAAKRPLDIGERARPFAPDAAEDLIEGADLARLHTFAGAIGLSRCRF